MENDNYNNIFENMGRFVLKVSDEKDLSVSVEVDDVNADTNMYLHESEIMESEIIHNTIDDYDEASFDENARYCSDCGCKMDYENDMGAFRTSTSPQKPDRSLTIGG